MVEEVGTLVEVVFASVLDFLKGKLKAAERIKLEEYKAELKAKLQIALWGEKLRLESFRELYAERTSLYKDVWTQIDAVSIDRWHPGEGGVPQHIQKLMRERWIHPIHSG